MCVRQRARSGVLAALLCAVVGIAGCGRPPPVGEPGEITGFVGGAAADAPRAALVARGVLSGGGTAVDAAVAAYFALAVTYPVAAGLGGGGVCAVYDAPSQTADTIEFLPRSPAAGGPVSVPGAVRGIAALHARYGRLDWGFLLEPAERFASEGHSVSRALARALAKTTPQILANRELRAIFGRDEGVVEEGQMLVQIELAAVIRQIKLRGSGSFYQGQAAGLLIEGIEAAGGTGHGRGPSHLPTGVARGRGAAFRRSRRLHPFRRRRWAAFSPARCGRCLPTPTATPRPPWRRAPISWPRSRRAPSPTARSSWRRTVSRRFARIPWFRATGPRSTPSSRWRSRCRGEAIPTARPAIRRASSPRTAEARWWPAA